MHCHLVVATCDVTHIINSHQHQEEFGNTSQFFRKSVSMPSTANTKVVVDSVDHRFTTILLVSIQFESGARQVTFESLNDFCKLNCFRERIFKKVNFFGSVFYFFGQTTNYVSNISVINILFKVCIYRISNKIYSKT